MEYKVQRNNNINFELQIYQFLKITNAIKVSASAQALYLQILNIFKNKFFPNQLQIDNGTLQCRTHLSRQQLTNARAELQKLSVLEYTPGSGSASGEYQLIDISELKPDSVIEISKKNDGEIANLTDLRKEVDKLVGDHKIWGNYILDALNKAITTKRKGIYNNYYATTQAFLKAKNDLTFDTLYRLIIILENKPDIKDKQSYILTVVANKVQENKRQFGVA